MNRPRIHRPRHRIRIPELGQEESATGGIEAAGVGAGYCGGILAAEGEIRGAGFESSVCSCCEGECEGKVVLHFEQGYVVVLEWKVDGVPCIYISIVQSLTSTQTNCIVSHP